MTKKADDKRGAFDSLRLDLAEIGDEVWSDQPAANPDDGTASAMSAPDDAHAASPASAQRPQRATRLRTREEIFEHRMAVMAHRRAQLDAHRNRQARKWFALTGALLFVGASGLGAFYYRTADDWKFLSAYSLDTPAYQSVQTASAAAGGNTWDSSASSHFQNTEALATSPATEPQQRPVEEITEVAAIEVPRLPDPQPEETAEAAREPVAPAAALSQPEENLAAPEPSVAALEPAAKPAPNFVRPETKRFVRVAPTAMPAPPKTVYNLNNTKPAATTSELIMVPVEPAKQEATQKIASLSPAITAPKTSNNAANDVSARSETDDAAIESALSVPPKSMELDSAALTGADTTSEEAAASPLPASDGKAVSVLLERGDKLLLLGDIVSARQLYQHAFQQGDQLAAARIGSTYDPRIFAQLGVQGLKPNSRLALEWYNKAVDAGDESAKQTARSLSRQLGEN